NPWPFRGAVLIYSPGDSANRAFREPVESRPVWRDLAGVIIPHRGVFRKPTSLDALRQFIGPPCGPGIRSPFDLNTGPWLFISAAEKTHCTGSHMVQLVATQGVRRGSFIPVTGPRFTIGRDATCQLRPRSEEVSRHHARLTITRGSVVIS